MRIREISRAGTQNKMDDKLMKLKKIFRSKKLTSLTSRAEHFVVKCQWYTENSTNNNSETNECGMDSRRNPYIYERILVCNVLTVYMYAYDSNDGWQFNSR